MAKVLFYVVRFLIQFYTVVTYPIYAIVYHPWTRVDPEEAKAEVVEKTDKSVTVRSVPIPCQVRDEIQAQEPKVQTMADLFIFMVNKFGNRAAVGSRQQIREEKSEENGKILTKMIQGEYEWKRYKDLMEEAVLRHFDSFYLIVMRHCFCLGQFREGSPRIGH